MPLFWQGFVTALVLLWLVVVVGRFLVKAHRWWRKWYTKLPWRLKFGLALVQWGATILVSRKTPWVKKDAMNGRWWISPMVKGFELDQ